MRLYFLLHIIQPLFVSIHASVKDATRYVRKTGVERMVSIHASVKDATNPNYYGQRSTSVSIHASVKDATLLFYHRLNVIYCFNPRICKRCDNPAITFLRTSTVSIHASVKDATIRRNRSVRSGWFQSTHL